MCVYIVDGKLHEESCVYILLMGSYMRSRVCIVVYQ